MANVWEEVLRLTKTRFTHEQQMPPPILEALDGRASSYDIDAEWSPSYNGFPRSDRKQAFGGEEFLGGVRTIAYLAAMLPIGTPRRTRLLDLHRKITQRLENPELLLYGGHVEEEHGQESARTNEALVVSDNYLYFRPKFLERDPDLAACERLARPLWPGAAYPWSGYFPVWKVWRSPGFAAIAARLAETPVPEGRCEIDPRVSAAHLVEQMRALHDLNEDAATLFLQLLTLADAADAVLAEVNAWNPARYKDAAAALVARNLVLAKKQPRSTRKYVLAGTWETLKPPNPALESWKLPLYEATMEGQDVVAPLGRLLPLRPVHLVFAEAFERHAAEVPAARRKAARAPSKGRGRDWIAEIGKNPDDDELRLVYADWLSEHDDPRGELIVVQTRRAELEKLADPDDRTLANLTELRRTEDALFEKHRTEWTAEIHPFVRDVRFERGFIVGVTAHAPTFVKHAKAIFGAAPLLTQLTLDAGPVGPIPMTHWRQLVGCEHFGRMTHLDTTSDHYIADEADLELLLRGEYCPQLRWLRIGYHRANDGLGLRGTMILASSARLSELRFLDYPGQRAGIRSVRAILESKQLTKLETLRLPFNGITDAQARSLGQALAQGLAPALRTLDFANTLTPEAPPGSSPEFVTQAVQLSRNDVGASTEAAIAETLRKR